MVKPLYFVLQKIEQDELHMNLPKQTLMLYQFKEICHNLGVINQCTCLKKGRQTF